METIINFLLREWMGAPFAVWFAPILVLCLVLGYFTLRTPFRIHRRTRDGEFTLETKPPPEKRKVNGKRGRPLK